MLKINYIRAQNINIQINLITYKYSKLKDKTYKYLKKKIKIRLSYV